MAFGLLSAISAQYFFGLLPCKLCLYQRYLYLLALCISLCGIFISESKQKYCIMLFVVVLLILFCQIILGIYHVGIENKWWTSSISCVNRNVNELSFEQYKDAIMSAPLVLCDVRQTTVWKFSMTELATIYSTISLYVFWFVQKK